LKKKKELCYVVVKYELNCNCNLHFIGLLKGLNTSLCHLEFEAFDLFLGKRDFTCFEINFYEHISMFSMRYNVLA
jgi:hypothetical protein